MLNARTARFSGPFRVLESPHAGPAAALCQDHVAGRHGGRAAAGAGLAAVRLGQPDRRRGSRSQPPHAARRGLAVHLGRRHRAVTRQRQPAARRRDGRAARLGRVCAALRQRHGQRGHRGAGQAGVVHRGARADLGQRGPPGGVSMAAGGPQLRTRSNGRPRSLRSGRSCRSSSPPPTTTPWDAASGWRPRPRSATRARWCRR